MATLTCHTDGCGNAGEEIAYDMGEATAAICGVCGNEITDIVP